MANVGFGCLGVGTWAWGFAPCAWAPCQALAAGALCACCLGTSLRDLCTMWCGCLLMSCLAAQTRLHRITPYPCYAVGSGVWLVRCCFVSAIAWACEWYSRCLCWLAPCSCIERSATIPLQYSPYALCFGVCFGSCVGYLLRALRWFAGHPISAS